MKLLVTGGAGFIGSHFVQSVLRPPPSSRPSEKSRVSSVTVLDALTYAGNRANLCAVEDDSRLRFVHGDIRDARLVEALLPGHDVVVHCAAESHVDRSIAAGGDFVSTNVLGTQTLLEAALRAGVSTFLHVSTDEVYGSTATGSWTEEQPLRPSSPYSASKASSDLLALAYHRTHGLDVRITRCSNNYGPRQHPEKLIPRFLTSLMSGGTVPLYGDGYQVRDWLHVEDHCRALRLVLRGGRPGEIYHVGGGTELTNKQLTQRLLGACGADWDRVEHVPDRKGHDERYSVDWSKLRRELGYAPRRSFEEGLDETITWYRANPAWWGSPAGARV
ncbi:dTDP-glucose 4,6-dehydratase [Streptomyces sp. LaBMicrA B280]|uniref:dTDP-glucose 4,6-dehydratase n=1 Tax=Streptomyces sp. LaBMicrA B280 TaxID=3391001 RepID=UPI003BA5E628